MWGVSMKKLGSTDIGELEFQLTYYTGYTCKVIAHTDYVLDVTITNYEKNRVEYVLSIELTYDGLMLDVLTGVHGRADDVDIVSGIDRALKTFNRLWKGF